MNPYVAWLKSNIPIVVLVVVMIAAAVVLPILSSGMNASLREEVKKRAANDAALARITQSKIEIQVPGEPAITGPGPVNPRTLELLKQYEQRLSADVAAVRDLILSRNRSGRELLLPALFPNPPSDWRDNLQFQMWRALSAKYESLISDIDAGLPPTADELQVDLRRAEEQIRTQKLAKAATDQLTPEQQEELRTAMREARMARYSERAQQLKLYASLGSINAPSWDERTPLDIRQLFDWEWQTWIKQDILQALYSANDTYESLVLGPVKRVRWLEVEALPLPANTGTGNQPTGSTPFGMTPPAAQAPPAQGAPAAAPPDAKAEAPREFASSFTGRVSNPLYDVRRVKLSIVVDSARIPVVLDAIASQNLMTVIDLKMKPTDAHADLANGFIYGKDICADLELVVETIWLREWTTPLMPREVKEALVPPAS